MEKIPKPVKKYLSELGRKGGKSKSDKKMKAINNNMKKALSLRWPKNVKNKPVNTSSLDGVR